MLNSSIYLVQKTRLSRAGHAHNATHEHKEVKAKAPVTAKTQAHGGFPDSKSGRFAAIR
jgi:hypothetical protein